MALSRTAVFITPPSLLELNKLGSYCLKHIDLARFLRLVNSMSQRHPWGQKNKIWIWKAVDHFKPGILAWSVREHSAGTFNPVWAVVEVWQCYFHVTDGWAAYSGSILDCRLFLRPIFTCVEGENTRLRHYLAQLQRKTLCYSKKVSALRFPPRWPLWIIVWHIWINSFRVCNNKIKLFTVQINKYEFWSNL